MQVEPATVALDELVRATLAGLEAQVKSKNVRLIAELPPRMGAIDTDPGKLRQVLINLVGNAIKFTERGRVTVRVETDPADGRPLALDVIDTGIGIPADKLHTIFEAFQQGDASTARHYGGTGLGLTIARSLCRLLGYGIEVHSRVGYGSMFRVVLGEKGEATPQLPRRPLTGEIVMRAEQAARLPDLKSKRVLIIDDESDSRMLLTQYLEDCGCQVLAVDQGARGLEAADQFRPDLILLDLLMPVMDGLGFLDALRRDPRYVRLPVIVVTVKDLTPDETARLEADRSIIVRKGADMARELERVVGRVLGPKVGEAAP
jgi:CheY-like chemotaxis protein